MDEIYPSFLSEVESTEFRQIPLRARESLELRHRYWTSEYFFSQYCICDLLRKKNHHQDENNYFITRADYSHDKDSRLRGKTEILRTGLAGLIVRFWALIPNSDHA